MSYDCYCDYDPAIVFSSYTVKSARKIHKCCECGSFILPGESYEYVFGIWDGWKDTYKTCGNCQDLRQWVKNNVPCFCWAYSTMIENATETIQEAFYRAKDEVAGLRFGFGRRVVKIRRQSRARRKEYQDAYVAQKVSDKEAKARVA